ncbi:MAG TPA: methyltransferase domain-containing protein [Bacteroidota bacterium]|nr:methyltransferase domain-containing protein [Bacteroidota bacterium]
MGGTADGEFAGSGPFDPSNRGGRDPLDEVRRFYDDLAPDYDRMTDFDSRMVRDRPLFEMLTRRFGIRRALDAGCGTGFHSILLALSGVEVTAIDISPEMVRLAKENAARVGVTIHAFRCPLTELEGLLEAGPSGEPAGGPAGGIMRSPFDGVFCLGNTLAHLRDDATLEKTLRNFGAVVRPGGTLFLQMLNYERILSRRDEVLNVRRVGDTVFERKYSYGRETITFTVSLTELQGDPRRETNRIRSGSVALRPITRDLLLDALRRSEFRNTAVYGDLALGPYSPEHSTDLIAVASP